MLAPCYSAILILLGSQNGGGFVPASHPELVFGAKPSFVRPSLLTDEQRSDLKALALDCLQKAEPLVNTSTHKDCANDLASLASAWRHLSTDRAKSFLEKAWAENKLIPASEGDANYSIIPTWCAVDF